MRCGIFVIILLCAFFHTCSESTQPEYNLNDDQFDFILYDGLTTSQVINVKNALENNYNRIAGDLKVTNMPKVTVKIWSDYNNFMKAMEDDIGIRYLGATGYVYGMHELRIFYNGQVAVAAVHEFAHLVSMQVNSSIANNPRWLWEAVALYENNEFVDPRTLSYMVNGDYPTLEELNADYNSGNNYIYSVGYILIEYVVNTWGTDNVISLIENNGNIPGLLAITVQEFEYGWYEFVKQKYIH
jgi:hypothetical protein